MNTSDALAASIKKALNILGECGICSLQLIAYGDHGFETNMETEAQEE